MAEIEDINKILKDINVKKSAGPDLILPAFVKEVANIINEPLKNIINEMLSISTFPDYGKIVHVTTIFKTDKIFYQFSYQHTGKNIAQIMY